MSKIFDTFLENTLKHEGYYSNSAWDRGGETLYGISRVHHPKWEGWECWDKVSKDKVPSRDAAWGLFEGMVGDFHKEEYWDRVRGDSLPFRLALFVADTAVNMGVGRAIRFLQESVGTVVDGIIGPNTLRTTNSSNFEVVLGRMFDLRMEYYGVHSPEDTRRKAMKGWSKRAREVYVQSLEWR